MPLPPLALLVPGFGGTTQQPLLVALSTALEARGVLARRVAVAAPRARPSPELHEETAALERARESAPPHGRLALIGRSFGGRVCTYLAAARPPDALIVVGYPIRPPGKRRARDEQALSTVSCPTLIVQGDRDELGPLEVLREVVAGNPAVALHVVEGAAHQLGSRKREAAAIEAVVSWLASQLGLATRE